MTRLTLAAIFAIGVVLKHTFASPISLTTARIVGGDDAKPGQFPYQVSLKLRKSHHCGGTIVTRKHIVTAAHCIYGATNNPRNDFTVVTGTISISTGGQTHRVAAANYHPGYVPSSNESYRNDIAVVTLADSMTFNQYQKPISVAKLTPPVGANLTLSGWGQQGAKEPLSEYLKTSTFTLISNKKCHDLTHAKIYDGQMCTLREAGVGACFGDSGGPLVYKNKLVGIVSWVYPCGLGLPDGYTRVSQYIDFINQLIATT